MAPVPGGSVVAGSAAVRAGALPWLAGVEGATR